MKIKLSHIFSVSAVLLLLLGVGMTFATSFMLDNFGHEESSASLHFARAAGAAVLGIALMLWLARKSGPSDARNALTAGLVLFFFMEAIVDLRAIFNGTYGSEAWFTGVIPWVVFLVLTVIAARREMKEG